MHRKPLTNHILASLTTRRLALPLLTAILASALGLLLLVGLAAAQDGSSVPVSSTRARTSTTLVAGQSVSETDATIVPFVGPAVNLPPEGRIATEVATPAWMADLMALDAPQGIVVDGLTISKAAVPAAFNGDLITYTIRLTNTSGNILFNVALRDVLPRGALRDLQCRNGCTQITESRLIPEPLGGSILVTETRELSWTIPSIVPGIPEVRTFSGRIVGQSDGAVIKNQAFANFVQGENVLAASSNEVQTTILVSTVEGVGAAISKSPNWFSSDRGGTLGLDWGDYDRDGDLDLALASYVGTTIYRNDDGQMRRVWSNTRRSFGVRWGDFIGDSALELVVVGDQGDVGGLNYIYRVAGTTVNEIADASPFSSTEQLARVAAGDFDGDGDLDLVVSTNGINALCPVLLYRNGGAANFSPDAADAASACISRRATAAIGVGDVDNDGDLDLALGLFPNSLQLFRNDGRAHFTAGSSIDSTATFLPYDFAWGDYDGDGFLDLAAAYPLMRQARIYRNNNGAGFDPPIILRTERFLTPFSLDWGDFTGDGRIDLAVGDLSPTIYAYEDGAFVNRDQLTTDIQSGQAWALRGVDIDSDGDLDLTLTNRDGPSVIFTTFSPLLSTQLITVPSTIELAAAPASSVIWADLNGDALLDLFFGAGPNQVSSKWYSNRQGNFDREDEVTLGGFGPHVVAVGDVDKDGNLDLAIGAGQNILVYLAGNVTSADWTSVPLPASPTALAWGDYDDDGDLDLLAATAGNSLLLYRNDAVGVGIVGLTAQPVWRSTQLLNATSLAWADLNADNYLDFAVGVDGGLNRIYTNTLISNIGATEIFVPVLAWHPTIKDDATRAVAWGDYDGDGYLDLAVGNYGAANLIYRNISTPACLAAKTCPAILSASPIWQSTTLSKTTSLAWGDWNNDGDLDLAVGNDNEVDQVFVNRGAQLFWLWSSPEQARTTGVAWGDVDNDGDLDLAVSQVGNGHNGFYPNTLISPAHLQDNYAARVPLPNNPRYLSVERPGDADSAYFYSSPQILAGPTQSVISVTYRLYDPNDLRSTPATLVPLSALNFQFSVDGGGTWTQATGAHTLGPILFEQSGQQATPTFYLPAGLSRFTLKHTGSRNFSVWLLDSDGVQIDLLVNEIGNFEGGKALNIETAGTYLLNVTADGSWTIEIQPSDSTVPIGSSRESSVLFSPTREGSDQTFLWNARADKAISENALFRVTLAQPDRVGPVNRAEAAAVSPPFRVRATSCRWPSNLRIIHTPANPTPGESVRFVASVQASGSLSIVWNFGDGSTAAGVLVNHTFTRDGTYPVTVSVQGEACPTTRRQVLIDPVVVGSGVSPIFLPLIMDQVAGARVGGSDGDRVVTLDAPAQDDRPRLPAPVTGFMGTHETDGALTLRWDRPPADDEIEGFRLYTSADGLEFEPSTEIAADLTTYRIDAPACGSAYFVTAIGRDGESPASDGAFYVAPCAGGTE